MGRVYGFRGFGCAGLGFWGIVLLQRTIKRKLQNGIVYGLRV